MHPSRLRYRRSKRRALDALLSEIHDSLVPSAPPDGLDPPPPTKAASPTYRGGPGFHKQCRNQRRRRTPNASEGSNSTARQVSTAGDAVSAPSAKSSE